VQTSRTLKVGSRRARE